MMRDRLRFFRYILAFAIAISLFCQIKAQALSVTTVAGNAYSGYRAGAQGYGRLQSPFDQVLDSAGNIYSVNLNHFITKTSPSGEVSILAGANVRGNTDATAIAARFYSPRFLAFDGSQFIYISDYNNHRIRKLDINTAAVTTLAGSSAGYVDAQGTSAKFRNPTGIAIDSLGNIFVADAGNRRIRKIDSSGNVTTVAGTGSSGNTDGLATSARFSWPEQINFDNTGRLLIVDRNIDRIRRLYESNGTMMVETVAGSTRGDSTGTTATALFNLPRGVVSDSSGNIYVADAGNFKIKKITAAGVVSEVAGSGNGYADGDETKAVFSSPAGLILKDDNTLLVADYTNHAVRQIDLSGTFTNPEVHTIAGRNSASFLDGKFGLNRLRRPRGLAYDSAGNLFIADGDNNRIRKLDASGVMTSFAGSSRGFADGTGNGAQFYTPTDLTIDGSDNLYVADYNNNRIRKITPAGVVTTYAGTGSGGFTNGNGDIARFNRPRGLEIDSSGNIYVADEGNRRIRMIDTSQVVTTFAGTGSAGRVDGPATSARFYSPTDLCLASDGSFIVTDRTTHSIRKISNESGTLFVNTLAGGLSSGFSDGEGLNALFNGPEGVACDGSGNFYVADLANQRIRKVDSSGKVTTVAGSGLAGFADNSLEKASFLNPSTLIYRSNELILADRDNHRIRTIDLSSVSSSSTSGSNTIDNNLFVSTFSGHLGVAGYQDGDASIARLSSPHGMAQDSAGNIYIADRNNHRIRKIDTEGNTVTLAGTGVRGFADGISKLAQFNYPSDITVDSAGNVYVADYGNHKIRMISPSGTVSTFAGSSSGNTDGIGSAAKFRNPIGLDIDSADNIYVADFSNARIRKIDTSATVTTVAGISAGFVDGEISIARFNRPYDVAVTDTGIIYVSDQSNNRIRKIESGVVTTLAGSGTASFKDGTGGLAQFRTPSYIDLDSSGNLYVSDLGNNRIRKISPSGEVITIAGLGLPAFRDGKTSVAQVRPRGILLDSKDDIYFTDVYHRVRFISEEEKPTVIEKPPIIISPDNQAPIVELINDIAFDANRAFIIREGTNLALKVFAYDVEDGFNVQSSLVWQSSLQGLLVEKARAFDTSSLSVGRHEIEVSTLDSSGIRGVTKFTLEVVGVDEDLDGNNGGADRNGDGVIDDNDRVLVTQSRKSKLVSISFPKKTKKLRFAKRSKLKAIAVELDDNNEVVDDLSSQVIWERLKVTDENLANIANTELREFLAEGNVLKLRKLPRGQHLIFARVDDSESILKVTVKKRRVIVERQ